MAKNYILYNDEQQKTITFNGVRADKITYNGNLVYQRQQRLSTMLSGTVAAAGSPPSANTWYTTQVTTSGYWNLSDWDKIVSISGSFTGGLSYWTGGSTITYDKEIFLKFADNTTLSIWNPASASHRYYSSDTQTSWSATNINLSSYTAAQKRKVYIYAVNRVKCGDTYGSYYSELRVNTTACTVG